MSARSATSKGGSAHQVCGARSATAARAAGGGQEVRQRWRDKEAQRPHPLSHFREASNVAPRKCRTFGVLTALAKLSCTRENTIRFHSQFVSIPQPCIPDKAF